MTEPGFWHHCHHEPDHDPAACVAGQLADIRAQLGRMDEKLEKIAMSQSDVAGSS
jgi:hypothetical protein